MLPAWSLLGVLACPDRLGLAWQEVLLLAHSWAGLPRHIVAVSLACASPAPLAPCTTAALDCKCSTVCLVPAQVWGMLQRGVDRAAPGVYLPMPSNRVASASLLMLL